MKIRSILFSLLFVLLLFTISGAEELEPTSEAVPDFRLGVNVIEIGISVHAMDKPSLSAPYRQFSFDFPKSGHGFSLGVTVSDRGEYTSSYAYTKILDAKRDTRKRLTIGIYNVRYKSYIYNNQPFICFGQEFGDFKGWNRFVEIGYPAALKAAFIYYF
jgi:hypothetical protein